MKDTERRLYSYSMLIFVINLSHSENNFTYRRRIENGQDKNIMNTIFNSKNGFRYVYTIT